MNPGFVGSKTNSVPLSTNEQTAPYIIVRELNLRKLPGRQWELLTVTMKIWLQKLGLK